MMTGEEMAGRIIPDKLTMIVYLTQFYELFKHEPLPPGNRNMLSTINFCWMLVGRCWVGVFLLIDFQDVAFLPSRARFPPHFLNFFLEVNALGLPHVLNLWLEVSKDMLPVKYLRSNKAFFVSVEFHGDHKTVTELR